MNKYDELMMTLARECAKMSRAKRNKVGAVLTRNNNILKIGYNGTISGQDNNCETLEKCQHCNGTGRNQYDRKCSICQGKKEIAVTSDFVLHAEQNIISFCAREGTPTDRSALYITLSPCKQCAKLIAQSGIIRVIYDEKYRDTDGIDFLKRVGVLVEQHGGT